MANGIVDAPFSRRAAVHACQAELFVLLARELIEAYRRAPELDLDAWLDLPEYKRFVAGAYATGFVCSDLAPIDDFDEMNTWPREHLVRAGFNRLRHWVHTLLRAERWADGLASPILDAIVSGALEIVAGRLEGDGSLKHQDVITDEI